jgi:cytohesin
MSLFQAAKKGDVAALRRLVAAGADANAQAKGRDTLFGVAVDSGTPLMAAAEAGHVDACRLLLEAGARVNAKNANGSTPLMHAAAPGHLGVVRLLLRAGAEVDAEDGQGRTALLVAAWAGHADVVGALLDAGADPDHKDKANGTSVLEWAAWQRHHEAVRRLLKAGADVDAPDHFGNTPLMTAVEYADPAMVRLLLRAGAHVNATNQAGYTALMEAADPKKIASARLLLRHGADVNLATTNFGETPLMSAGDDGDVRLIRLFLKAGAAVNRRDRDGETALYRAVEGGHRAAARLLLRHGADVNAGTTEGKTPLALVAEKGDAEFFELLRRAGARDTGGLARGLQEENLRQAAQQGDVKKVRALVRAGVDVNAKKPYESPALWHAADQGHLKVVEELLRAGARPNLTGEYGSAPLHKAAEGGHAATARALIAAGADVSADYDRCMPEEYEGWTALMAAAEDGHAGMVRDLLAAGADPNARTVLGYTPLLLAVVGRRREAADALRKAGAEVDETAAHFLKVLDFAEAARRPEFRKAAQALGKVCGVKPRRHRDFPDGVLYNVGRGRRADRVRPQVVKELTAECLARGGAETEAEARKAAGSAAEYLVPDRVLARVIDEAQEKFLRRGYYVVGAKLGIGTEFLALLPTDDKYAVLACLGPNAGGGVPSHIRWLKELEQDQPFELAGAGYDTLKLRFPGPVGDPEGLLRRVSRLGPRGRGRPDEVGVLVDGRMTPGERSRDLAGALRRGRPTLRLWWD